jgi:hypothetical protein
VGKWFPTILTVAIGVLGQASPDIQAAVSQHPNLLLGLGTAYALLKGFLPSPIASSSSPSKPQP